MIDQVNIIELIKEDLTNFLYILDSFLVHVNLPVKTK